MLRNYFLTVSCFGILFFTSCDNTKVEHDTDLKSHENVDSIANLSGYVNSGENYVLKQVSKKSLTLIGKFYEAEHKNISTLIIGTMNVLNDYIIENKIKISGSIMCVYDTIPVENEKIKIFVGIPIENKIATKSDFAMMKLPAGDYHKATVSLGLGKTTKMWDFITNKLRSDGFEIPMPLIEYPSDARNFDMTTEITHSNLLIPVKTQK